MEDLIEAAAADDHGLLYRALSGLPASDDHVDEPNPSFGIDRRIRESPGRSHELAVESNERRCTQCIDISVQRDGCKWCFLGTLVVLVCNVSKGRVVSCSSQLEHCSRRILLVD